ncbi:MAG: hypothetical protein AAF352_06500 [Pseudomonadota bacterium]
MTFFPRALAPAFPLTLSQKHNVLGAQSIQLEISRTEQRLATGRRIGFVSDEPHTYFRSKSLTNHAEDYDRYNQDIQVSLGYFRSFSDTYQNVDALLGQLLQITQYARNANESDRALYTQQFNAVGREIANLTRDSEVAGINLLQHTNQVLRTRTGRHTDSVVEVNGINLASTNVANTGVTNQLFSGAVFRTANDGLNFSEIGGFSESGFSAIAGSFSDVYADFYNALKTTRDRLRPHAQRLSVNAEILQQRLEFNQSYTVRLRTAADSLVAADLTAESAKLSALQTRYQLSIQTIQSSGRQLSGILSLLQ